MSIGEVERLVEASLGPMPEVVRRQSKSFLMMRARRIASTEDLEAFETFGFPPERETSQGRANIVGYPVLYAALNRMVAMHEINAADGETIHLSLWQLAEGRHLDMCLQLFDDLHPDNPFREWQLAALEMFHQTIDADSDEARERALLGRRLWCRLFRESNQALTARLAHRLLYFQHDIDALVYPSVVDPAACNIAVAPEAVSRALHLVQTFEVALQHEGSAILWKRTGEPQSGRIVWRPFSSDDASALGLEEVQGPTPKRRDA